MKAPNTDTNHNTAGAGPLRTPPAETGARSKVRVINPVWNGLRMIRRKDAEFYVREGRAAWAGCDLLRLINSHPKNIAAAARASEFAASTDHCHSAERAFGSKFADTNTRHHITRPKPGGIKWTARLDNARTGYGGSVKTVFLTPATH